MRQVLQMFPNFPQQVILEDLRQTRSVEVTIDNILENRLQAVSSLDTCLLTPSNVEGPQNVISVSVLVCLAFLVYETYSDEMW